MLIKLICPKSTQGPNLRSNSSQEGEDDAYMESHTQGTQGVMNEGDAPALEGPMTRGKLKTKWVYRNKLNENGKVVRNKTRDSIKWMLIKDALLNGIINEEVYVKAFYGLKQAPCAWYEKKNSFYRNGFSKGKVGTTLFRKNYYSHFIILMQKEFEMSMIGELKFFLELQIKQTNDDIYIHHTK
ncbi:hypothetical protein CR513_49049, partial [Mucuna pruriens]